MEHPWFEVGTVFPREPYTLVDRYFVHDNGGIRQRSGWAYVAAEQERLQVQNVRRQRLWGRSRVFGNGGFLDHRSHQERR
jgi:hypothetical protein